MKIAKHIITLGLFILGFGLAAFWFGWKLVIVLMIILWAVNRENRLRK